MKLDALTRYEIEAEAFYRMTGKMAPGKSVPMEIARDDMEERLNLWRDWQHKYRDIILAFSAAIARVLPDEDDE